VPSPASSFTSAGSQIPPPNPQQLARRERFESLIGLAAPFLDLMLVVGDRVSRIVSPGDEYIPIRPPAEAFELEPAKRNGEGGEPRRELAD
jgi:hypothetical protein